MNKIANDQANLGFVRQSQLIPEILPFSSATLWRKVKAGDFPQPIKLSSRITAWRMCEVMAWIAEKSDGSLNQNKQI